MKLNFLFILFFSPFIVQAQAMIGNNRQDIKNFLTKNMSAEKESSNLIIETDTTLSLKTKHDGIDREQFYRFDKNNRCVLEQFSTISDKEYQHKFNATLHKKRYKWKSINLNQFISKYSKNILLEVQMINGIYSIIFIKTNMDKALYHLLLKNK